MENEENKVLNWQKKSHEALLKLLNNIGIIGSILAAVADIIFVVIMVVGVKVDVPLKAILIFAIINAFVGILISTLLRYQGQKYAELENEELCKQFYNKKIKEKKHISMSWWMTLQTIKDIIIKGGTTTFSIFGMIYISIEGSKNPIQILITFATLILFACFGLVGMNSAYCRFYNVQVPIMKLKVEDIKVVDNVSENEKNTQVGCRTSKKDDKKEVDRQPKRSKKVSQNLNESLTEQIKVNQVIEEINKEHDNNKRHRVSQS